MHMDSYLKWITVMSVPQKSLKKLTLQISKLTKAVVLNSFPHGRFWQFVYKENVRCTRLMQRSLQVVIRQMFVLCSMSTEGLTSLSTSIKLKYCVIKRISHYSIDAPGQLLKVSVAYWACNLTIVMIRKYLKGDKCWSIEWIFAMAANFSYFVQ
jgi:hypothetical protein